MKWTVVRMDNISNMRNSKKDSYLLVVYNISLVVSERLVEWYTNLITWYQSELDLKDMIWKFVEDKSGKKDYPIYSYFDRVNNKE